MRALRTFSNRGKPGIQTLVVNGVPKGRKDPDWVQGSKKKAGGDKKIHQQKKHYLTEGK